MKIKRLDRPDWGFQYYPYYQMHVDFEDFHGLVGLIILTDGERQYWKMPKAGKFPICGENMMWLQMIPDGGKRAVTAHYVYKKSISQGSEFPYSVVIWYADVIEKTFFKEDGVAAFVDEYLDVIFTPQGDVVTDDVDELEEAFQTGELTKEQFDAAITEGEMIVKELCSDLKKTEEACNKLLDHVLKKIDSGEKPFKERQSICPKGKTR